MLKEPAPTVAVSELADSSVNLVGRPWCRGTDHWPLRFHLMRHLKEDIEASGCSIPFPQRDVHLFQASGASGPSQSVQRAVRARVRRRWPARGADLRRTLCGPIRRKWRGAS